ncbi:hypothetical protein [Pontiella agarivorans]|uniref:Uncharacterized protein n=1 Tax=Pontiella agarivorans TaxID=3038953 RepID=A0ABU5MU50_9BACT|nr:hypothetical protein [Pontiella agarivorans]MDZ8117677.1 hypothetical protein [Pontiella agarivorans]
MNKLAVAVIHYHLRPGGVTRVIERAVESLNDRIDFFCISGEATSEDAQLFPISGTFQPLEYSNAADFPTPEKSVKELRQLARNHFGRDPDIWHIHNHALGKNGFMPQLVWTLAGAGCRLLLQPHDFAEDGRAANYKLLTEALGENLNQILYPDAEHIVYAPINFRDKSFLENIGLSNVRELPNSVTAHEASPLGKTTRTIVYPARAIRRKNLGEFLLWSLLAPEGYLFQSTLAPQNPKWQVYYDEWVKFAEELNLPVEFDAGRKHDFSELVHNADALMTTSIQEGFGLAFLEPWLEGKNLIGRRLPEITTDFETEGLNLSGLYESLPVPLAWAGETTFFQTLEKAMREMYTAYSKPWNPAILAEAESALVKNGTVDFGILDEALQRNVIRHLAAHPEDRKQLPPLPLTPAAGVIEINRSIAESHYSQAAYANRLLELYQDLAAAEPGDITSGHAPALLDQFLKPERFNLLRT